MHFDDRLATVLRHRAAGPRAARTQFRQLVDLLDTSKMARDSSLLAAAWLRLGALGGIVPPAERAAILRDPSVRIRNPELAAHLAEDEPDVAAAALAKATLGDDDWSALIPRLPIRARGFLRLRKDLPEGAQALLDRLGVHDRGLPLPAAEVRSENEVLELADEVGDDAPQHATEPTPEPIAEDTEIGALVKRIEEFRKARTTPDTDAPRLPLGDRHPDAERPPLPGFAFTSNADGRIDWAEPALAPALVGMRLGDTSDALASAVALRQPVGGICATIIGAPRVSGDWVVDASPRFATVGGHFIGHAGRFRRAPEIVYDRSESPESEESGRIRQLLHELKTPVNAIQGFAEMIQQQLFGPTPHDYRALAASIAGDSARILAGFDELDRLAKLETGALEPEDGSSDFAAIVTRTSEQLRAVLDPRTAGFEARLTDHACIIPLAHGDSEALCWRVLATIAGAAGAGEQMALSLDCTDTEALLTCELPASLASEKDIFAATARAPGGALSAGAFGAGFSFRLARAEASAIGGSLARVDDSILLVLPLLTEGDAAHSPVGEGHANDR